MTASPIRLTPRMPRPSPARPGSPAPAQLSAPAPAAPGSVSGACRQAIDRMTAAARWASDGLPGRADEVALITLGLVARVNVLLLGPPGTAKTLVVDRLASVIDLRGGVFSTMLTKFSKPSEVLGPTDIAALQRGELRTNFAGYLPTAGIGVLDEVFKGSSAILNSMLTIANERRVRDGSGWFDCSDLRVIVGMSNEPPEDPVVLAAFYDRLPLKRTVGYVSSPDFRAALAAVSSPLPSPPARVTAADLDEIDRSVAACVVPDSVLNSIAEIRIKLGKHKIITSDRRWLQSLRVLKARAVLAGRLIVEPNDLDALADVLWSSPEQRAVIGDVLGEHVTPHRAGIRARVSATMGAIEKVLTSGQYGAQENLTAAAATAGSVSNVVRQAVDVMAKLKPVVVGKDVETHGLASSWLVRAATAMDQAAIGNPGCLEMLATVKAECPAL